MSEWTDFRDRAIGTIKDWTGNIGEQAKQDATTWLINEGLPMLTAAADNIIPKLQADAKDESGWCKARDYFVFPLLIRGGLWGAKLVCNKTAKQAAE